MRLNLLEAKISGLDELIKKLSALRDLDTEIPRSMLHDFEEDSNRLSRTMKKISMVVSLSSMESEPESLENYEDVFGEPRNWISDAAEEGHAPSRYLECGTLIRDLIG